MNLIIPRSCSYLTVSSVVLLCIVKSSAFAPPTRTSLSPLLTHPPKTNNSYNRLYFFGRGKKDEDSKAADDDDEDVPFFARFGLGKKTDDDGASTTAEKDDAEDSTMNAFQAAIAEYATDKKADSSDSVVQQAAVASSPPPPPPVPKPRKPSPMEDLSPTERAAALRAQAEKIRLEVELTEAELTLSKISKLEKEIAQAKKTSSSDGDDDDTKPEKKKKKKDIEPLQREMAALQAKMRGEEPPPVVIPKKEASDSSSSSGSSEADDNPAFRIKERIMPENGFSSSKSIPIDEYDPENVEMVKAFIDNSPAFLQKTLAGQVELSMDNINTTEIAVRVDKLKRFDYGFSSREKPRFSREEIDEKIAELNSGWTKQLLVDAQIKEAAGGNETELALLALEYEYYSVSNSLEITPEQLLEMSGDDNDIMKLVQSLNVSGVDATIETLYPKCTRKEGAAPTLAQAEKLISDVLPKAQFSSTSRPETVEGGFIIRGFPKDGISGNDLIDNIDAQLERNNLADKMTVLFTTDFTVLTSPDFEREDWTPDQMQQVLYVTGPDLVREPQRVALSTTSAVGVATSWYLSLYPFMLNPALSKRVDEQLALADASMTPDLTWLTDLSLPLFTTFVAIQLVHELAHRAAAAFYGVKLSVPTWVPSLITGITSSVTTFKTLPKNKQAMFDISIAGPLFGMLASVAAIGLGAQMTATMDAASFPALPLEILRQSTLGGGIVENSLNGVLSVPEGAMGSAAIQEMMIPLHPMAVAGYISLVLNAMALLPVGNTDGGRVAMTIFGRIGKPAIGSVFMFALLSVGILGSDLFLFYFAFCLAFQSGNEVPARNEVELLDFSRIVVATGAYVLAALALVPFQ